MDYTAVIATRNRPEALALSLPLLLSQSRPPARVLVIDSSDDPAPSAALIAGLPGVSHQTAPRGASLQRNIGLRQVETEVVFFPDDDSLCNSGALAAMMRIYERDTEGRIGGVCSAEAMAPPPGVLSGAYSMARSDSLKARLTRARRAVEERLVPDPFHLVAARKAARLPPPPGWLASENAVTVPWMTGFRMSFRTESLRRRPFCEDLGAYALFEDADAGFGVQDRQWLVGARDAQIFHHKFPSRRANGRALGAMQILNRAFVVARSGERDAALRRAMRRFFRWKLAQYALAVPSGGAFARDRLAGARAAAARADALMEAAPEGLGALYLRLRAECFASEG